jgi:hypothetical protein
MKSALNYIIIVVATAILQLFLPWWVIVVVPFLVYIVRSDTPLIAYIISLAGVATVWFAYALFLNISTQASMSDRIAQIFLLPSGSILAVVTLVGGLAAGFGGLAGHYVRQLFVKEAY